MKIEKDILQRYASGQCTMEESNLVEAWFEEVESNASISDEKLDAIVARLDKKIVPKTKKPDRIIWTTLAAACLCAVVGIVMYQYTTEPLAQVNVIADISDIKAPTTSQAFLVLEDQKAYNLDDVKVGDTLRASGYALARAEDGEFQYVDMRETGEAPYHTLRTKAGRGVSIKLSDGSSVWVNANSEIRYPVRFAAVREVKLSGEAYFEVAKTGQGKEAAPFLVRGDRQTIQVFGTKFNANYQDNSIALLEGKIALSNQGSSLESKTLVPQAVVMQPGQVYVGEKLVSDPNIDRYIDWKEGYFDVEGMSLGEFSKELSNWYGVEVEVAAELQNKLLLGHINRQKDLVDVLDIVAKVFPIRYMLKDNKVMITER
ncbi:FecR domain-containing protein [Olivibacter sp. CPCC 100613]|uniref:FecR family protein n=1 Tax=Olivibacter sp. CPCC 100613 TaxID=3079931 RepID=UPI002FF5E7BB